MNINSFPWNNGAAVSVHRNNSLERIASQLESDAEQSLVFERFLPAQEILVPV
jgi:hypothetical protein